MLIFLSYDFVRACLPRGMARACSLSHILFPQASALTKSLEYLFLYNLAILYVHACLGIWFEPVVSHSYFSLRRQHLQNRWNIYFYSKNEHSLSAIFIEPAYTVSLISNFGRSCL
ncbi:hypothetical protein CD129_08845 [Mammaliicoccus fleurettii]|nr:hypothetical protein CD129_08845 [Mammaliicoccus fleurettii]